MSYTVPLWGPHAFWMTTRNRLRFLCLGQAELTDVTDHVFADQCSFQQLQALDDSSQLHVMWCQCLLQKIPDDLKMVKENCTATTDLKLLPKLLQQGQDKWDITFYEQSEKLFLISLSQPGMIVLNHICCLLCCSDGMSLCVITS